MSITRKIKRNKGIIKKLTERFDYCRPCRAIMDEKQGYGYICPRCGKFKPYEKKEEVNNG